MLCAVFFELLWLDVFAVGTYVPPMPAYSFVVFVFLLQTSRGGTGGELLIALAISSVPAYIQTIIDARHRAFQTNAYTTLMSAAELSAPLGRLPGRLIFCAASRHLIIGLVVFFPVLLCAAGLYDLAKNALISNTSLSFVPGTYAAAAAALGATAALRLRKAYAVFLVCILLFLL